MKSEDQRFEQVKNKIAESEKPAKGSKEGDVEATIGGMKKELSDLLNESDAPQQKKASGIVKIVVFLVVIVLIIIVGTKLIGLW